ncbi:MAG TPA: orotate phosphoribosyltransferase [Ferruginibacter sp.]|nr:orotate phosphoribosyltransferase [Ferruginibacter sp.]HRO17007.1 orotate phosphoribosyltransferase [Ferruginibacter sp.]HRQ20434.1 orotate phosphoribosyltransferase [Ferruginibacter sp.]
MTDAKAVASKLLQAEAVQLSPDVPFTWASGWKSPIYCDNRKLLSFPFIRDFVKSELCSIIFEQYPEADVIAGVATAGIAWGAMAADQLKMPFVYVRPEPKKHGMQNQIEGYLEPGKKVLVVEDLISTGMSSLKACDAIRANGNEVCGMVALFSYGFPQAAQAFETAGIRYITLSDYETLIQLATTQGKLDSSDVASLLKWRSNPADWGRID